MDIAELINKFGLPAGLLIYFIWRDYQTSKEHKADMRDIAVKSVQAIDKGTEALKDAVEVTEKNNTVISENSSLLQQIKGVLLSRKQGNGSENGT